jgi:hypothetical protein
MKHSIIFYLILLFPCLIFAQGKDTINQSERVFVEMAANASSYNSLSLSIEKEFTYGKFKFGPRVELLNPFGNQSYTAGDSIYIMNAQIRVRLLQVEYQVTNKIRVGIAPSWLLGPLPRNGWYKVPTSIYAHVQLKDKLSFEPSITTSIKELIQFSIRREF